MATGLYWDERCFWHSGGNYALTMPAGGLVQPMPSGLPENPETKRRLLNLLRVSGILNHLDLVEAAPATREDLARIHPDSYLDAFSEASAAGGGELGLRTPFGPGGYEIAAQSAGLAVAALRDVLSGRFDNAYALSRPPGHHCLPDWPNGFCLLANIPIALEAARTEGRIARAAVIDWDVHHGNGTEAIYLEDPDILTISLHQERNYPLDTGDASVRGAENCNINIPLPPGTGHLGYLDAFDRLVAPALRKHRPDVIVVACGFDAAAVDPLSRMLATAETFRSLTDRTKTMAEELCNGRLLLVHEGGYSEAYVPFCGHATLEALSGAPVLAMDPLAATLAARQPGPRFDAFVSAEIDALALFLGGAAP